MEILLLGISSGFMGHLFCTCMQTLPLHCTCLSPYPKLINRLINQGHTIMKVFKLQYGLTCNKLEKRENNYIEG